MLFRSPESPVTTEIFRAGNSTLTDFKLFCRTPIRRIGGLVRVGVASVGMCLGVPRISGRVIGGSQGEVDTQDARNLVLARRGRVSKID